MIILPAIDIKDGTCVRLTRGKFETAEQVAEDAVETALTFQQDGASWIHIVDLDGAKTGAPVNHNIVLAIARETDLAIEVGGGIRDLTTIGYYLENGIERIVLGSIAVSDPDLVRRALDRYGSRIAVGIDAMYGQVKTRGWLDDGAISALSLAQEMVRLGVETIIYTDIAKDGTLTGPSLDQLEELKTKVSAQIIASGGVTTLDDVRRLKQMGLYGAILGKAIYHHTLLLTDALSLCETKEVKEDAR